MDIKKQVRAIREKQKELEREVLALQTQCSHPEYVEGLTMAAVIQCVAICTTCGHSKPIDFSGDGDGVEAGLVNCGCDDWDRDVGAILDVDACLSTLMIHESVGHAWDR